MSRFSGAQAAGASRQRRTSARAEAEQRNAAALPERRAEFRRQRARIRAALDERELRMLQASLAPGGAE